MEQSISREGFHLPPNILTLFQGPYAGDVWKSIGICSINHVHAKAKITVELNVVTAYPQFR